MRYTNLQYPVGLHDPLSPLAMALLADDPLWNLVGAR